MVCNGKCTDLYGGEVMIFYKMSVRFMKFECTLLRVFWSGNSVKGNRIHTLLWTDKE